MFFLFFVHSTRLCHLTSFMSSWIPTHTHTHIDHILLGPRLNICICIQTAAVYLAIAFIFWFPSASTLCFTLLFPIRWDFPARRRASVLIAFSISTIAHRYNLSISFQFFPQRDDLSTIHDDMMERTACRPNRALRLPCYFLPLQLSKKDIAVNGDVATRDTIELLVGPNHEDVSSLDE